MLIQMLSVSFNVIQPKGMKETSVICEHTKIEIRPLRFKADALLHYVYIQGTKLHFNLKKR